MTSWNPVWTEHEGILIIDLSVWCQHAAVSQSLGSTNHSTAVVVYWVLPADLIHFLSDYLFGYIWLGYVRRQDKHLLNPVPILMV